MPKANWETLYTENEAALLLYARQFVSNRSQCEDIVHDAFVKLIEKRSLEDHSNPKAILFKAVRWTALDMIRKNERRKIKEAESNWFEEGERSSEIEPSEVTELVQELPTQQKEVLVLHVWGDLTFREIGEQLQISGNTAASRYRAAINKLRNKRKIWPENK